MTSISYNCKGFTSSVPYILQLLAQCDVLCLTETWLRPEELYMIETIINDHFACSDQCNFSVFSKSSMMDLDGCQRGRPFGGMAIIMKHSNELTYREVSLSNDRLQAVQFLDRSGNVIHLLCNVYMPFFCNANTEEFVSTLDQLQALLDDPTNNCPVKFMGDFNTQLPRSSTLTPRWERAEGFHAHSKIMHDFLSSNNLLVADFLSPQPVHYTFFCISRNAFSWIDHVFFSSYDSQHILTINRTLGCRQFKRPSPHPHPFLYIATPSCGCPDRTSPSTSRAPSTSLGQSRQK
jgi:hypothetical protein